MGKPSLFNLAAAVSLLLCVAVARLWVRSFRASDTVARFGHPIGVHQCFTARGSVTYVRHYSAGAGSDGAVWWGRWGAALPAEQERSLTHPVAPGVGFFRGATLSLKN